jgi:hypothetical protein
MMSAKWRKNVFSRVFCERLLTSLRQPWVKTGIARLPVTMAATSRRSS